MADVQQTNNPLIITSHGMDGACCAGMVLQKHPKAEIIITSARRIPYTIEDISTQNQLPKNIFICGLGIYESFDRLLAALEKLKSLKVKTIWFCGRGYLDDYEQALNQVCNPVFEPCATNTECAFQYLKLNANEHSRRMLQLAAEYVNNKKQRNKQSRFWHAVVQAAAARYFKFEDRHGSINAIQKLAGVSPVTQADEEEAEAYLKAGEQTLPLGNSPAMKRLRSQIKKIGPLQESVLILGPSGSGKEIAARLLHDYSRLKGRFIPINCAILSTSSELAQDRLFGHVAGAYTGASNPQQGAFEIASGGTLFLDEVAELPVDVQTQLLRVLEEKTITPLGSSEPRPVDVRLVAATNQNLPRMITDGRFRNDLYHRLNVLMLRVPSLTERLEDMKSITQSVRHQLRQSGVTLKLSQADWDTIHAYHWPGNIRQFINVLKRVAYMGVSVEEALKNEDYQMASTDDTSLLPNSVSDIMPIKKLTARYARHAFSLHQRNITQTAKSLGIAVNTLKKHLNED